MPWTAASRLLFLFVVEGTLGFLLDGGAIQAFDKYVGKEETSATNHRYHSEDTARNSPWANRYYIWIPSFFHRDLTLLTTIMARGWAKAK